MISSLRHKKNPKFRRTEFRVKFLKEKITEKQELE